MSIAVLTSIAGAVTDSAITTVPVTIRKIVLSPGTAATTLVIKDDTTVLATFNAAANGAPCDMDFRDGWIIPTKLTVTTTGAAMSAVIFK